jgi:electron-transferring-flavoprotein dehydrogenase
MPRRFADVNEDFDPQSIDRESDKVDVCIVGGGKLVLVP